MAGDGTGSADDDWDCTICSEPLAVPGASLTKCGHVFHTACIERWFEQKLTCPLCKSKAHANGFTRLLRAPAPLGDDELTRMQELSSAAGPGGADAAIGRLRRQLNQHEHDLSVSVEAVDNERQLLQHRRAAVHKLEVEKLKLQRELTAAKRVEANAMAAAAADAEAGDAVEAAAPRAPLAAAESTAQQLPSDRSVSAEAVKQQSRQLAWRCQELRDLDEKIKAATAAAAARQRKRQKQA